MLELPKSLIGFGAKILSMRAAQRLQRRGIGRAEQENAREHLLRSLAGTAFGREHGLTGQLTFGQWQQRVPLRAYAHFIPYIKRMASGEAGVLWPGVCHRFARTAGTSGEPKRLPVTDALVEHFQLAGQQALLQYVVRTGQTSILRGRHLVLAASAQKEAWGEQAQVGDLSGLLLHETPGWVRRQYQVPDLRTAEIPDWGKRLEAIVAECRTQDISAIAGLPTCVVALLEALRRGLPEAQQRAFATASIWPRLECIAHLGQPLAPYAEQLRQVAGPKVTFHELYPSTEGFIGAQDAEAAAGLRLITGAKLFFEFLPLAEYQENRLPALGGKTVPVEGLQPGIDYVVILTTPGGLSRYVLGDIIRFLSTDPARFVHVGTVAQLLAPWPEAPAEKELTEALTLICQRHGWKIVNFHVAPLPAKVLGTLKPGYEWWVELRPGTTETPTGPGLAAELDLELQRTHEAYRQRRRSGSMEAPVARLVMPGVFEQWERDNRRWGGQHKFPRSRSDRLVADGLSRLSPFSAS